MANNSFSKSALIRQTLNPGVAQLLGQRASAGSPPPTPPPAQPGPPPTPPPPSAAPPAVPAAPVMNPFASLPFRSPGDRIKADDFNALAKGLQIIGDMYALSGALFGSSYAQAKLLLTAQQYQIARVVSVFGAEVDSLDDTSLDTRKVIQAVPVSLGDKRLLLVVTEAVETRRFAPNLLGLTYREALERQRAIVGEGTFPSTPITLSSLTAQSLKDAAQLLTR